MGGRKKGNISEVIGGSKQVREQQQKLEQAVRNESARGTVNAAAGVLATSDPVIGKIVVAGKILHLICSFYEAYQKNYQRTGDEGEAVKAATYEVAGRLFWGAKHYILGSMISYGWDKIKERTGILSTATLDNLVISAASSTLVGAL